ncbi:MAG: hypothetical protein J6125_04710 [Clostridia bacterium]|nr:hypothetical protein [Clostridia bacterium]
MKALLPTRGIQYRANLHAHTTLSDGSFEPSDLIEGYRAGGYAVLALTDHERPGDLAGLVRPDVLLLRGFEAAFGEAGRGTPTRRTCHVVFLEKNPDAAPPASFLPPPDARVYDPDAVCEALFRASACGWWPILAHPFWSLEDPRDFVRYEGLGGVEVYNHLCAEAGSDDRSAVALDAFARAGRALLPVAADDAHGAPAFGGFEMICARELSYPAVVEALQAGDAYASTGPLILSLASEDGALVFSSSEVRTARLVSDVRPVGARLSDPAGCLTAGRIPFDPAAAWVRLELTDVDGRTAWTRPYRADEL